MSWLNVWWKAFFFSRVRAWCCFKCEGRVFCFANGIVASRKIQHTQHNVGLGHAAWLSLCFCLCLPLPCFKTPLGVPVAGPCRGDVLRHVAFTSWVLSKAQQRKASKCCMFLLREVGWQGVLVGSNENWGRLSGGGAGGRRWGGGGGTGW